MEPKDDKDLEENVYNVTSEYENLSIEREAKLVQQLNTAVHYWLQLLDLVSLFNCIISSYTNVMRFLL